MGGKLEENSTQAPVAAASGFAVGVAATEQSVAEKSPAYAAMIGLRVERVSVAASPVPHDPPS